MPVALTNVINQPLDSNSVFVGVEQAEFECEDIDGLRVGFDDAVIGDEFFVEAFFDLVEELIEFFGVGVSSECICGAGHQFGAVCEVCGCEYGFVGVGIDAEPVAISFGGTDEIVTRIFAEIDPGDHGVVVFFEDSFVAIDLIDSPGAYHSGIGPGGGAAVTDDDAGGDVREGTVGALSIFEVYEPLGEECGDVVVVCCGTDEDLGVACPAEAFIALGTVCGNLDEVGSLGGNNIFVELVGHFIGAFEGAGERGVGAEGQARDVVDCRSAGVAGDFDVLEAVEGETRLIDLVAHTFTDVGVGCASQAQAGQIYGAVFVESFGES